MKGGRSRGGGFDSFHHRGRGGNRIRNNYHINNSGQSNYSNRGHHSHNHHGSNMGGGNGEGMLFSIHDIPQDVQKFLTDLVTAVRSVRVHEIRHLYDTTFNHLTEQHFKIDVATGLAKQHWPNPSVVAPFFENDTLLTILYKELYYRYQHQLRDMNEHVRQESWENYNNFFDYILAARDGHVKFDLPQSWLWDIMDEFIYQMVTCCLSRKRDSRIWNPTPVIHLLERVIERSNVRSLLVEVAAGRLPPSSLTDYGPQHLLRMMGHNAIIMLLRVYTQLGDYYTALRMLERYEIRLLTGNERSAVYTAVPACYMTLHYYAGFCCIMLRRYADAYRLLTSSLRCKNYHIMSYQQQVITTLLRHAQSALSLVNTLCPQRLDIHATGSRDDLDWHAMDEEAFANTFKKACPKYITPYSEDHSVDVSFKLMQAHCSLLYREVQQQECIPFLRSYIRLYDEISTEKLASLQSDARMTSVEDVTRNLLCWKHKAYQLTYVSPPSAQVRKSVTGHGLRGDLCSAMGGCVDFMIEGTHVKVLRSGSDAGLGFEMSSTGAMSYASYLSNGSAASGAQSAATQNTVYHLLRELHVVKEMGRTLEQATIPTASQTGTAVAAGDKAGIGATNLGGNNAAVAPSS